MLNESMTDSRGTQLTSRNVTFYGSGETNNQKRKTNNPLYRNLLEQNWLLYSKVPNSKKMKESYVWDNIIQPIIADGGQFYNSTGDIIDECTEESRKFLLTKVSQALRDYKKKSNYSRTPSIAKSPTQIEIASSLKRKSIDDSEFEFPIKFGFGSYEKVCLGMATKKMKQLQDDIQHLGIDYRRKIEDIALESIVTQEELATQLEIGQQKDELILLQSLEIATLRHGVALLKSKIKEIESKR